MGDLNEGAIGDGWNYDMSAAPVGETCHVSFDTGDGVLMVHRARMSSDGEWWVEGHGQTYPHARFYAHRPLPSPTPLPDHREASE